MTQDIQVGRVPATRVVSLRGRVATPPDQLALWSSLMAQVASAGVAIVATPLAVYHNNGMAEGAWDIEVCVPVAEAVDVGSLTATVLPAAEVAVIVHYGPLARIGDAYEAMWAWMSANHRELAGPIREMNVRPPASPGDQNDPQSVMEIQFPIA